MLVAVLVVIFLVPVSYIFLKKLFGSSANLPPGPNTWQLVRKFSEFGKKPHLAITSLAKIYGPIMSFQLGSQVVIIASSAAAAKEIFKTQDQNFSGRYWTWVFCKLPTIRHSSLVMSKGCNTTWKLLRDISQNVIFSSKSVDSNAGMRKAKVVEMVEYLRTKHGQVVRLDDLIDSTISNIISDILVSRDLFDVTSSDGNTTRALVDEIVEMISSSVGLSDLFPILRSLDFRSGRKAMEIHKKIMYIWEDIVKERRSERSDNGVKYATSAPDFLDVLLDHGFPDDQICNVTMELLAAGMDTSGITSVWLMVELIKNPQILHRVIDEIANAFEGRDDHQMLIDESVLSCECHYLQACIKETLRLHVPGPLLMPRRAIETCKIDDYTVPKDSVVLVNAWAISMDPDTWKDATSFNPDRFLGSRIDFRGNHFEFVPFGSGRRMCPGFNLALKDIQLMVASLVHYFDWTLPNGLDPTQIDTADKFGTVLKKETPLILIPNRRK